jgi:hypothetical protein
MQLQVELISEDSPPCIGIFTHTDHIMKICEVSGLETHYVNTLVST